MANTDSEEEEEEEEEEENGALGASSPTLLLPDATEAIEREGGALLPRRGLPMGLSAPSHLPTLVGYG